ncbi:MAG: hypothetical protein QOG62_509 [Thermoleophilaceae bacterium]|nr:hypothetical protein [Thermoleophilaceae bacterium]
MATRRQKRSRTERRRDHTSEAAPGPLADEGQTEEDAAGRDGAAPKAGREFLSAARAAYREGAAEQDRVRGPRKKSRLLANRAPAPWDPFPLTEVVIAGGAIAVVVGLLRGPANGVVLTTAGVAVCLLAVLEFTAREHLTGHRSHALVLALLLMVAIHSGLYYGFGWRGPLAFAIDLILFGALAVGLRELFDRRAAADAAA